MVIDSETDDTPHAIGPVIQRKAKTQQQQPQPVRQPPIQETYLMRNLTKENMSREIGRAHV